MAVYTARCLLHMFQPPFFSPINAQAMLLGILVHTAAGRDRAALCPLGWLFSLVGAQLRFLGPTTHPRAPPFAPKTQGRRGGRSWRRSRPFFFIPGRAKQHQASSTGRRSRGRARRCLGHPGAAPPPHLQPCRTPTASLTAARIMPSSCKDARGGLSTTQPPWRPPSRVPKCHPPELGASVPPPGDPCRCPRGGQRSPGTGTAAPR